MHSRFKDLVPKTIDIDDPDLEKPGIEDIEEVSNNACFFALLILFVFQKQTIHN